MAIKDMCTAGIALIQVDKAIGGRDSIPSDLQSADNTCPGVSNVHSLKGAKIMDTVGKKQGEGRVFPPSLHILVGQSASPL